MLNTNTNLQTQTSSVLHNDTVSSCSTSKVQEKTQLSRSRCMNSLRAIQSQFKFLIETLQDFGTMPIFKRTFSQDLDLLENHLTKEIISQTDCKTTLTKLRTTFKTTEQITSLLANNVELKAQIQENIFAIVALKNDIRKLKGNSVDTKFDKTPVLGKPVLPSLRNQSVVRQPNAFKSERAQMSKQRFASQVDVNKNLSKPATQHYLPKKIESAFAKLNHVIASSSSRNSSKNMPRFSSNDMVHNHYLDEARKKIQKRDRNSKTSVMPSAIFQSRHMFSLNKTSVVYEKTSPISDLKWKPTGRIFKSVGLRWIPIGKLFDSCASKFDSEPPYGSNVDIPNIHECKQTLDVSAELESLFGPLFDEYFNGENQVVSKSSVVTTADTSDKCQQQPDSTSSTSTLTTTVTADGNFDMQIFLFFSLF
ncbi:hypothetical protein Tco_0733102 [Tanacetum coccineum]